MTHFAIDVIPGRERQRIDVTMPQFASPKTCTCKCEGCKDHREPGPELFGLPIRYDRGIGGRQIRIEPFIEKRSE